jgi:hypothetical protein
MATNRQTPWGHSDSAKSFADGITWYSTPSHGGFLLSEERYDALQEMFEFPTFAGGFWFEEDCDAAAVMIAFPEFFESDRVNACVRAAKHMEKLNEKWERVLAYCETPTVG